MIDENKRGTSPEPTHHHQHPTGEMEASRGRPLKVQKTSRLTVFGQEHVLCCEPGPSAQLGRPM